MHKEYIIYCDESIEKGKFYSDFYGGVLVSSDDLDFLTNSLESKKLDLNLKNEIKWTRVTANYLEKYKALMDVFFEFVHQGKIKGRVMFRQEAFQAQNLTDYSKQHGYFLLYYQFVKHAFGLAYSNKTTKPIFLRVFFDELPDSKEKSELFKNNIYALQSLQLFVSANLKIRKNDIGEVNSKDHVLLQCLDVVLGAIAFRLNDLHKAKSPETGKRGKRTVAKEELYKHILNKIRICYKNFNIGVSTGDRGDIQNRWKDPYRHWNFKPRDHKVDDTRFKQKSPT
jgi:hypothetical protein